MQQDTMLPLHTEGALGLELWRSLVGALEAAGEAALRTSRRAGVEVVSRLLAPTMSRALSEVQQSGALEAMGEIAALSELAQDWDGEGGKPATEAAKNQALALLTHAYAGVSFAKLATWKRPAVSTSGDGGVDLSWIGTERSALFIVYPAPANDMVVCVTQKQGAAPQRVVLPLAEAVRKVVWVLGDG
jgi:hypothetical protein